MRGARSNDYCTLPLTNGVKHTRIEKDEINVPIALSAFRDKIWYFMCIIIAQSHIQHFWVMQFLSISPYIYIYKSESVTCACDFNGVSLCDYRIEQCTQSRPTCVSTVTGDELCVLQVPASAPLIVFCQAWAVGVATRHLTACQLIWILLKHDITLQCNTIQYNTIQYNTI